MRFHSLDIRPRSRRKRRLAKLVSHLFARLAANELNQKLRQQSPPQPRVFTGLGPRDALTLPRSFHKTNEIATNRSKTGEPVFWPCPAPLTDILADAPKHDAVTLCANSDGKPWTVSGFRASWRKVRLKLEHDGKVGPALTLYGLRHTVAVILREIGMDERTIADALGQKTLEMARHYAKCADLRPKMRGVVRSFDEELNRRKTKVVKPAD